MMTDNDPKELDPSWNDVPSGLGQETSSFEGPEIWVSQGGSVGTGLARESAQRTQKEK